MTVNSFGSKYNAASGNMKKKTYGNKHVSKDKVYEVHDLPLRYENRSVSWKDKYVYFFTYLSKLSHLISDFAFGFTRISICCYSIRVISKITKIIIHILEFTSAMTFGYI